MSKPRPGRLNTPVPKRLGRNRRASGYTLLELMVSLFLGALVMSIAASLYVRSSGHFGKRVGESEALRESALLGREAGVLLCNPVLGCDPNDLRILRDGAETRLSALLAEHHPGLEITATECLSLDTNMGKLASGPGPEPSLVILKMWRILGRDTVRFSVPVLRRL